MEEIKRGEYARTENGRIAKLTEPLVYEFRDELKNLLDLYQKEKEKNKKLENKIKSVLELIDTKLYTAYTLYGEILYDDENIRELLEERN